MLEQIKSAAKEAEYDYIKLITEDYKGYEVYKLGIDFWS